MDLWSQRLLLRDGGVPQVAHSALHDDEVLLDCTSLPFMMVGSPRLHLSALHDGGVPLGCTSLPFMVVGSPRLHTLPFMMVGSLQATPLCSPANQHHPGRFPFGSSGSLYA